jgi:hypothetical protein
MKNLNKKEKQGFVYKGPDYSVVIKYSPRAIKQGLIKFIPKDGKPFEMRTEDFVQLLALHVNAEVLSPAMINNKMIKMIQVARMITFTPHRDIKAGETVNIPYRHMHPIEFAIAEEALGVLNIASGVKTINEKEYKKAEQRVTQAVNDFAHEQWNALIKNISNNQGSS